MKTEDRERHRWEEIEDNLFKCKFCGSFRSRRANVCGMTFSKKMKNTGNWIYEYSKKGSSKYTLDAPNCRIESSC